MVRTVAKEREHAQYLEDPAQSTMHVTKELLNNIIDFNVDLHDKCLSGVQSPIILTTSHGHPDEQHHNRNPEHNQPPDEHAIPTRQEYRVNCDRARAEDFQQSFSHVQITDLQQRLDDLDLPNSSRTRLTACIKK